MLTAGLRLLAGAASLTLGRKLFWLFVAALGFEFGVLVATRVFRGESDLLVIGIALLGGVLGALLALALQNLVVGVVGFIAGGYLLVALTQALGLELMHVAWLPFIIGGVLGAVFVAVLFDWALIVLSSLNGALIIADVFSPRNGVLTLFVVLVLCLIGVSIQAGLWRTERRAR